MANELLSKTMVITLDSSAIARSTGWTFNVDKEPIDVTSFDSNGWKEFKVDLKEAEISFDGLVSRESNNGFDYEALLSSIINSDASISYALTDSGAGTATVISGSGFLTNVSATGSLGDKQTYSGTIKPSGTISLA